MNKDLGTTEALMFENNHRLLTGQEFRQRLFGNTILGDFAFAFKYIMTIGTDGTLEGINNVGSHHHGQMTIDDATNTITVKWQTGWINNTSRAYEVEGEIKLYEIENGNWITTFTKVMPGTDYAMEVVE